MTRNILPGKDLQIITDINNLVELKKQVIKTSGIIELTINFKRNLWRTCSFTYLTLEIKKKICKSTDFVLIENLPKITLSNVNPLNELSINLGNSKLNFLKYSFFF